MLSWCLVLAIRAEADAVLMPESFLGLSAELKMRPSELLVRYR